MDKVSGKCGSPEAMGEPDVDMAGGTELEDDSKIGEVVRVLCPQLYFKSKSHEADLYRSLETTPRSRPQAATA